MTNLCADPWCMFLLLTGCHSAGIASFVKAVKLPQLNGDPTDSVAVVIWGGAEGAITIMAASIPVLRMLFRGSNGQSPAQFATIDEQRLNATATVKLDTLDTLDTNNSQNEATAYGCTPPLAPQKDERPLSLSKETAR